MIDIFQQHPSILFLHARSLYEIAKSRHRDAVSAFPAPRHVLTNAHYDSWVLAVSFTALIMICFASSALLLAINRHGFVTLSGGQRGEAYFFIPNTPLEIAQECLYTVNVS